jgi:hypothetical protein
VLNYGLQYILGLENGNMGSSVLLRIYLTSTTVLATSSVPTFFFFFFGAGNGTQGLKNAGQVLYPSPVVNFFILLPY